MDSFLLDLSTLAAALGVVLLCGAGIAALPWREAELEEALTALRALPGVLRGWLPPARRGGLPGSAPVH